MANCAYCGTFILFGGVSVGNERYCSDRCHQGGYVLKVAEQLPPQVVERHVEEIFRGNCPKCKGPGPVDVYKIHEVWSVLILTRWSTRPMVSCRHCATKGQLGGLLFSLFCGWWGFPWGLIITPIQIGRNIVGMCRGEPAQPSLDLRKLAQMNLGAQALLQVPAAQPPPLPG